MAIPLAQGAESLNVAVAAGILLYEVAAWPLIRSSPSPRGVVGLCFGSFLNVCILRLPHEQSLLRAAVHLPALRPAHRLVRQHPGRVVARAARQVPAVRQRRSRAQYPLIEALVGLLWVGGRTASGA